MQTEAEPGLCNQVIRVGAEAVECDINKQDESIKAGREFKSVGVLLLDPGQYRKGSRDMREGIQRGFGQAERHIGRGVQGHNDHNAADVRQPDPVEAGTQELTMLDPYISDHL